MFIIVDDNEDVLLSLGFIIEDQGYPFRTFTNGEDAWEFLRCCEAPVRMVISDYRLPGMDGVDFLQRVRELHGQAPRMLISGNPPRNIPPDIAVLRKPFQFEDFGQMVREILLRSSALPETRGAEER